jgi:outer membrane cobalamin receptor
MKRNLILFNITIPILILCSNSWAQRTSETSEWLFADPQQETTTATRSRHTVYESFTTVRVITRQELRLAGVQTVQEAIERLVPDLEAQEGSVHKFITARGAYSSSEFNERLLFLLDGMPANDPLFGNFSPAMLPTQEIERIEIAFGPGSAMYGPNAFAGVINIITRNSDTGIQAGFAGRGGYDSGLIWNSTNTLGAMRYTLSAAFRHDPGSNRTANSDTDSRNLHFGMNWNNKTGQQWNLQYRYLNMDRGSVGMRYGIVPTPLDRFKPESHYLTLEHRLEGVNTRQTFRLYGMAGTVNMMRDTTPGMQAIADTRFEQQMAGLDFLWQAHGQGSLFTLGTEVRTMHAKSVLIGDHQANNLAGFGQAEWNLGRWHPIVGLRYDRHSTYGNQLSPRLGMTFRLNNQSILRASYGQAFRAPSFNEQYLNGFVIWLQQGEGAIPLTIYGDPNLKPEIIKAFEFGMKNTLTDGWRTDFAWFDNKIGDAITLFEVDPNRPLDRVYKNVRNYSVQGWSAEVAKSFGSHFETSAAYMHIQNRAGFSDDVFSSPDRFIFRAAMKDNGPWSAQILFTYPSKTIGGRNANGALGYLTVGYCSDSRTRWNLRIDNLFNVENELAWRVPGGERSLWFTVNREW